ncbi:MAG: hypothetical protein KDA45_13280, partial [Planctomycetales bacterium]|nr:hypothetical protein [Planctomycetales bacterium]
MPTTKLHRNAGNPFGVVSPLCGLLLLLLLSGCQFAPNASALKWPWSKKDPSPTPERILAVWTDTVLHQ